MGNATNPFRVYMQKFAMGNATNSTRVHMQKFTIQNATNSFQRHIEDLIQKYRFRIYAVGIWYFILSASKSPEYSVSKKNKWKKNC